MPRNSPHTPQHFRTARGGISLPCFAHAEQSGEADGHCPPTEHFTGPPGELCSRVLRAAIFLEWIARKHSEHEGRQHGKFH